MYTLNILSRMVLKQIKWLLGISSTYCLPESVDSYTNSTGQGCMLHSLQALWITIGITEL